MSELSSWDDQLLGVALRDLSELVLDFDIEATGFAMAEIDLRIEGLDDAEDERDDILPMAGPPIAQTGELWQPGDHRPLCCSALDPLSWTSLMGDERAALAVTDPPTSGSMAMCRALPSISIVSLRWRRAKCPSQSSLIF